LRPPCVASYLAGMVALYPGYCEKFGWALDQTVLAAMKAKNAAKLTDLDAK
jgi:hypothetical protein